MTDTRLLDLSQLADRLGAGLTAEGLGKRIIKDSKTTGKLVIAGRTIHVHKVGNRWLLWATEIDQPHPLELQPVAKREEMPVGRFRFLDPRKSGSGQ